MVNDKTDISIKEMLLSFKPKPRCGVLHFLENLKEDDNPVLIMVYLKQNI